MKKNENILLKVDNLKKYYPRTAGVFKRVAYYVKAVDGIDFNIKKKETVGLVGESGCGKTTTGRCIMRLTEPTEGSIFYKLYDDGYIDIVKANKEVLKKIRRDVQIVFQDPFSSLNPRMSIRDIIAEPLLVNKIGNRKKNTERVESLLNRVGLSGYQMNRYPHEFSGGQRQRIGIARSLSLDPKLIVLDEPVSALDVSIQAQVLNLLSELQEEFGYTYLLVAHDLSVVEHISDRVMVMYLGKIVEMASSRETYQNPQHPYTEALMGSIPVGDPRMKKKRIQIKGDVPDPSNPPPGCNFNTRCKYAKDICSKEEPEIKKVKNKDDHYAACHFADELELAGYEKLRKGQVG